MNIHERLKKIDAFQQRHRRLAFGVAVIKRFSDDRGGQLAALIAYYAFVSLFPLLLVFVTVLGIVLEGDPTLKQSILESTQGQFPIVGDQLRLHSLPASGVALAIGLVGSLLGGLAVTNATQDAFNRIWQVPARRRLGFIATRLHGLRLLALFGLLNILSTTAAGFVGSSSGGTLEFLGGVVAALLFNLALFGGAFALLTNARVSWRELAPGVLLAAVVWQILQHVGGFYVEHVIKRAGPLSATFGLVLGLLAWLYLGAQVTVLATEVNVVRARRLWPRSFL
ncbi:MAG TPA: YihY/virulence factor BrkB family protein [Solirubrobacteraceae bacterium]